MEVIVRTSFDCNGTCVYCSSADSPKLAMRFDRTKLRILFERCLEWLSGSPPRTVRFLWFGGEPMMMGRDFYISVVDEQRAVFGPEISRVKNIMQSNLSLLSHPWVAVLRKLLNGSAIGTSYDFQPRVRGLQSSQAPDRVFVNSVGLLQRAGIRWGMIYVVHQDSIGRARQIYHYFRNLGAESIRFNPLCSEGRARSEACSPLLIAPDDYGRFLLELLDVWVEDGCRGDIPPISDWFRAFRGDKARLICDCLGQCWSTHMAVDPDGEVYLCSRASDARENAMGNVFSQSIATIMDHPIRKTLASRTKTLRQGECQSCNYFGLCHGGCPTGSMNGFGDYLRKSEWCDSRLPVFRRIEQLVGHGPQGPSP